MESNTTAEPNQQVRLALSLCCPLHKHNIISASDTQSSIFTEDQASPNVIMGGAQPQRGGTGATLGTTDDYSVSGGHTEPPRPPIGCGGTVASYTPSSSSSPSPSPSPPSAASPPPVCVFCMQPAADARLLRCSRVGRGWGLCAVPVPAPAPAPAAAPDSAELAPPPPPPAAPPPPPEVPVPVSVESSGRGPELVSRVGVDGGGVAEQYYGRENADKYVLELGTAAVSVSMKIKVLFVSSLVDLTACSFHIVHGPRGDQEGDIIAARESLGACTILYTPTHSGPHSLFYGSTLALDFFVHEQADSFALETLQALSYYNLKLVQTNCHSMLSKSTEPTSTFKNATALSYLMLRYVFIYEPGLFPTPSCSVYPWESLLDDSRQCTSEAHKFLKDILHQASCSPAPSLSSIAHFLSGVCHHKGVGTSVNLALAAKKYKESSKLGSTVAQYYRGLCHRDGLGVPRDLPKALTLFQASSNSGDIMAVSDLGQCYESGYGTPRDSSAAYNCFQRASSHCYALAQNNKGLMMLRGSGCVQDTRGALGHMWLAAQQGLGYAQDTMGWCCETGTGRCRDIREAVRWYKLACLAPGSGGTPINVRAQQALDRVLARH
ncbi:sel1 repeat family protein [Pelomyxa schiedti]|nr:sel1 repeat family protein [Pelomyxa schiedti]